MKDLPKRMRDIGKIRKHVKAVIPVMILAVSIPMDGCWRISPRTGSKDGAPTIIETANQLEIFRIDFN